MDVLKANDLFAADNAILGNGSSDPYVRVLVEGKQGVRETFRTQVVKRTLNPVWNAKSMFKVAPSDSDIVLHLFDKDSISKDDPLGKVTLRISDLSKQPSETWFDIKPCEGCPGATGRIYLRTAFFPDLEDSVHDAPALIEKETALVDSRRLSSVSTSSEGGDSDHYF